MIGLRRVSGFGCGVGVLGCWVGVLGCGVGVASGRTVGLLGCRLGRPPVGLEGFCSPPSVLALSTKTSPQCAKVTLLVGISIKNKRKISFSKVFATRRGRENTQSSPSLRSAQRAGVAIM